MQVKSFAECSKGSILQYFWPSTFIKLPFVIKILVLHIFERLFYTWQVLLYMHMHKAFASI